MLAQAYFLETPGRPLTRRPLELEEPGPDQALVEIAACGLCHTDLGFADGSVRPRHPLALVLGHEITGRVASAGESFADLVGKPVLVPSVLPCGECEFCLAGRGNACPRQQMPGNDIHGGFSTHVLVPARSLVALDEAPPGFAIEDLAVVADAVSTAYQACRRAELRPGDLAIVVGAGGVGGFVIQIARALGARVVACDVAPERLRQAALYGAEVTLEATESGRREIKERVREIAGEWDVPGLRRRIFECSGTPAGQLQAFDLLDRAAILVQVGYTPEKVPLRLSNLMAWDATLHGSWGCPPEAYPEVLRLIYARQITLEPFIEHAPMSELNELLARMADHRLTRRMILRPGAAPPEAGREETR